MSGGSFFSSKPGEEGLERENCSQNMSSVYTQGGGEIGIAEPFDLPREKLKQFLLSESFFSEAYIEKNRSFLDFLETASLPFNLDSMVRYIEHRSLKKQILTPATVKSRKYQMKRICRELILANPEKWTALDQFKLEAFFSRLNPGTRQSRAISRENVLSEKEVERLLNGASENWRLILIFLVTTGVRVSELVSIIRPRCVETKDAVRITLIGKGNKQRVVICRKDLFSRICKVFPSRYYLFCTSRGTQFSRKHIWRGCNRLGMRILGRPVGVHTFRHSLATQMIERGVELKRVSEYLGHSDTAITNDMYVHLEEISIEDIPTYGEADGKV